MPYGRGVPDIARAIKAETGSLQPLGEIEAEVQIMMDAWKTVTYPRAWQYMEECGATVTNPGYIQNPWGRRRRFPKRVFDDEVNGLQREAQNFPYLIGEVKQGEFGGSPERIIPSRAA